MPNIPFLALTDFATSLFVSAGVVKEDAETLARSLVGANLRGHDSHGVMRIPQYIGFIERKEYALGVPLTVDHETPAILVCDAQWGLGQVQAHRLLQRILPKAEALGLAAGAMRNCGHIGRLGEYAEIAAAAGIILLATVNNGASGQRVVAAGGHRTAPRHQSSLRGCSDDGR